MAIDQDLSQAKGVTLNRRRILRRHEDLQVVRLTKELEAAKHMSQALSQQTHVDALIDRALRTALDVVNAENGSLLLADPKTERLVFRHVVGEQASLLRDKAFSWHEGLAGAVFHSGKPEIIVDAKKDLRHFHAISAPTGFRTKDMIILPLKQWQGDPIGVLSVLNKRDGRLD